jgi:hypothetical protein
MRHLTLALLGRHGVELCEMVKYAVLCVGGELPEAGLALHRLLLLLRIEIAVLIHPLSEVFAANAGRGHVAALNRSRLLRAHLRGRLSTAEGLGRRLTAFDRSP